MIGASSSIHSHGENGQLLIFISMILYMSNGLGRHAYDRTMGLNIRVKQASYFCLSKRKVRNYRVGKKSFTLLPYTKYDKLIRDTAVRRYGLLSCGDVGMNPTIYRSSLLQM